jgi:hypothetical protein
MTPKKLPFESKDIHYDSVRGEVSLKREKFDNLIRFVQELLQESQEAENARDTARSRARRAETAAEVVTAYVDVVDKANKTIRNWVGKNTIQELSRRSRIPYATCHRIVRERLQNAEVDVGTLEKMLQAVQSVEEQAVQNLKVQASQNEKAADR